MYKKVIFISVFLITLLTGNQFTAADYALTNDSTTEPAWVAYSVWRPANGGWPAGWWTQGWEYVAPGTTRNLRVPENNTSIYIRVERNDSTEIKPPDYAKRDKSLFWVHPFEDFTVVETENGDILKSNVSNSDLEFAELYEYRNGGKHTIPEFHQDRVRIIYFLPNDLFPLEGIETKLNKLIKATQQFFAAEMHRHGFNGKTFTFETDQNGQPLVHWVDGWFADSYYHTDTSDKLLEEVKETFDLSQDLYLIFTDITSQSIGDEDTCGEGWNPTFEYWGYSEQHWAIVPAFGECLANGRALALVAHELGHAFGLEHDFRNDAYIMSYGDTPHQLAKCSAEWLDASKFFNARRVFSDKSTTLDEPMLFKSPPNAVCITFPIADIDGLQQVQLLIPTTDADRSEGVKLYGCKSLTNSAEAMVEFVIPKAAVPFDDTITLSVIDGLGNIERLEYTPVQEDILPAFLKPSAAAPALVQPEETIVFANYPNPFNPETWIPYQLAKPSHVTITLYSVDGSLIRTLPLGHQPAGVYQSKSRAAYWDGRNAQGEPVASGLYFFTLTAGDFAATRKMLIRK